MEITMSDDPVDYDDLKALAKKMQRKVKTMVAHSDVTDP
jgi:hypothetical protein